jgi:hypothetical protein
VLVGWLLHARVALVFPGDGEEESARSEADRLATATATLERELEFVLSLATRPFAIQPAKFREDHVRSTGRR